MSIESSWACSLVKDQWNVLRIQKKKRNRKDKKKEHSGHTEHSKDSKSPRVWSEVTSNLNALQCLKAPVTASITTTLWFVFIRGPQRIVGQATNKRTRLTWEEGERWREGWRGLGVEGYTSWCCSGCLRFLCGLFGGLVPRGGRSEATVYSAWTLQVKASPNLISPNIDINH